MCVQVVIIITESTGLNMISKRLLYLKNQDDNIAVILTLTSPNIPGRSFFLSLRSRWYRTSSFRLARLGLCDSTGPSLYTWRWGMINVQLVTIQLTKTGHNVTSQKLVTMSQIIRQLLPSISLQRNQPSTTLQQI